MWYLVIAVMIFVICLVAGTVFLRNDYKERYSLGIGVEDYSDEIFMIMGASFFFGLSWILAVPIALVYIVIEKYIAGGIEND